MQCQKESSSQEEPRLERVFKLTQMRSVVPSSFASTGNVRWSSAGDFLSQMERDSGLLVTVFSFTDDVGDPVFASWIILYDTTDESNVSFTRHGTRVLERGREQ
jgi:hypothetical protein